MDDYHKCAVIFYIYMLHISRNESERGNETSSTKDKDNQYFTSHASADKDKRLINMMNIPTEFVILSYNVKLRHLISVPSNVHKQAS